MLREIKFPPDVSSPRTIGDKSSKSDEQRTTVGEHSARDTKVQNVPDTLATHRRHIGDALNMLV